MPRISKDPDVRRADIMDASWELFLAKGFQSVSVGDIMEHLGISKGLFYYYFKSKDEILDAIVERNTQQGASYLRGIADSADLTPVQKLRAFATGGGEPDGLQETLHQPENSALHHRSLVRSVQCFAPILADVIAEGNALGVFHAAQPLETARLLLAGALLVFDPETFSLNAQEHMAHLEALQDLFEHALGAEPGSLEFFREIPD